MSVTPKGGGQGGQAVTRSKTDDQSLGARLRAGLEALVRRVPLARRLVPGSDDEDASDTSGDALADNSVSPPEGGSVSGLPDRRRPFTYPTRNLAEGNAVELVGETDRDTLTIAHPDNPDASITSDEWEPVER